MSQAIVLKGKTERQVKTQEFPLFHREYPSSLVSISVLPFRGINERLFLK